MHELQNPETLNPEIPNLAQLLARDAKGLPQRRLGNGSPENSLLPPRRGERATAATPPAACYGCGCGYCC